MSKKVDEITKGIYQVKNKFPNLDTMSLRKSDFDILAEHLKKTGDEFFYLDLKIRRV